MRALMLATLLYALKGDSPYNAKAMALHSELSTIKLIPLWCLFLGERSERNTAYGMSLDLWTWVIPLIDSVICIQTFLFLWQNLGKDHDCIYNYISLVLRLLCTMLCTIYNIYCGQTHHNTTSFHNNGIIWVVVTISSTVNKIMSATIAKQ